MLNFKPVVYFHGSRMFEPLKFYCRKNLLSAFVQFGKMSLIFILILPPGTEVNTVKRSWEAT